MKPERLEPRVFTKSLTLPVAFKEVLANKSAATVKLSEIPPITTSSIYDASYNLHHSSRT